MTDEQIVALVRTSVNDAVAAMTAEVQRVIADVVAQVNDQVNAALAAESEAMAAVAGPHEFVLRVDGAGRTIRRVHRDGQGLITSIEEQPAEERTEL